MLRPFPHPISKGDKMKMLIKSAFLFLLLIAPAPANDSPVAGVWTAELNEKPFIKLTVNDNGGKLSGNIVFYMLVQENGDWNVKADDPVCLINPRLEGQTFVFEVVHAKKHGSVDPADQEIKTFRMQLTGKDQGVFKGAANGGDVVLTRKPG
jgi:hypothetical protein